MSFHDRPSRSESNVIYRVLDPLPLINRCHAAQESSGSHSAKTFIVCTCYFPKVPSCLLWYGTYFGAYPLPRRPSTRTYTTICACYTSHEYKNTTTLFVCHDPTSFGAPVGTVYFFLVMSRAYAGDGANIAGLTMNTIQPNTLEGNYKQQHAWMAFILQDN